MISGRIIFASAKCSRNLVALKWPPFTATATPEVRRDILVQLGLQEPKEFVAGFARPNLRLSVHRVENENAKYVRLKALVAEQKTGIVYCATRKRVEAVHANLLGMGIKAIAYHGGLNEAERDLAQDQFMSRKHDVAVATNAFGMGIDRSDIRFVAHFEVPGSLEAYYQEAGRAGRGWRTGGLRVVFQLRRHPGAGVFHRRQQSEPRGHPGNLRCAAFVR